MSRIRYLRDLPPDAQELLNQLQEQTATGNSWVCRKSTTGRGWRLHEISSDEAEELGVSDAVCVTAYGALLVAMRKELSGAGR